MGFCLLAFQVMGHLCIHDDLYRRQGSYAQLLNDLLIFLDVDPRQEELAIEFDCQFLQDRRLKF